MEIMIILRLVGKPLIITSGSQVNPFLIAMYGLITRSSVGQLWKMFIDIKTVEVNRIEGFFTVSLILAESHSDILLLLFLR